jgi:hypothetical protein
MCSQRASEANKFLASPSEVQAGVIVDWIAVDLTALALRGISPAVAISPKRGALRP